MKTIVLSNLAAKQLDALPLAMQDAIDIAMQRYTITGTQWSGR